MLAASVCCRCTSPRCAEMPSLDQAVVPQLAALAVAAAAASEPAAPSAPAMSTAGTPRQREASQEPQPWFVCPISHVRLCTKASANLHAAFKAVLCTDLGLTKAQRFQTCLSCMSGSALTRNSLSDSASCTVTCKAAARVCRSLACSQQCKQLGLTFCSPEHLGCLSTDAPSETHARDQLDRASKLPWPTYRSHLYDVTALLQVVIYV